MDGGAGFLAIFIVASCASSATLVADNVGGADRLAERGLVTSRFEEPVEGTRSPRTTWTPRNALAALLDVSGTSRRAGRRAAGPRTLQTRPWGAQTRCP